MEFELNGETRRVGIHHIHLEEEAGKSMHAGDRLMDAEYSLIDYNRGGIPLIEIVTEPDIRSPEEARVFLENLKSILEYTQVSDCKMEQGSLRCDANISLRPKGSDAVRQQGGNQKPELVPGGAAGAGVRSAAADGAVGAGRASGRGDPPLGRGQGRHRHDADEGRGGRYRYMPEPDIPPLEIDPAWVDELRAELPELPRAKQQRFVEQYELPEYDAGVLTADAKVADFYEACVAAYGQAEGRQQLDHGRVFAPAAGRRRRGDTTCR